MMQYKVVAAVCAVGAVTSFTNALAQTDMQMHIAYCVGLLGAATDALSHIPHPSDPQINNYQSLIISRYKEAQRKIVIAASIYGVFMNFDIPYAFAMNNGSQDHQSCLKSGDANSAFCVKEKACLDQGDVPFDKPT